MKKFSVLILAIFAAVLFSGSSIVSANADSPLLARWEIVIAAPGQDLLGTLNLQKDGEGYKGAVITDMGEAPLNSIKINDDDTFTANIVANVQGQNFEGTTTGKLADGKITGEINLQGLGAIPYSGEKERVEI